MVSRLGFELSPDYSGMPAATADALARRGCSRSDSSTYHGVRLRRPRFPAAPPDFGLNCLATASLNSPGYCPRLKRLNKCVHTGAGFGDGFSVFLAESRS